MGCTSSSPKPSEHSGARYGRREPSRQAATPAETVLLPKAIPRLRDTPEEIADGWGEALAKAKELKLMFALRPVCELQPDNSTPSDVTASSDSGNFLALSVYRQFRQGKTRRMWIELIFRRIWQQIDMFDKRNTLRRALPGTPVTATPVEEDPPVYPTLQMQRRESQLLSHDLVDIEDSRARLLATIEVEEMQFESPLLYPNISTAPTHRLQDHAREVVEWLKQGKQLPMEYVKALLADAVEHFDKVDNVQVVGHPSVRTFGGHGPEQRYIVVGDLHGQLSDLLHILEEYGMPRRGTCVYIFNGDFVDRGKHGCEVMCLLLLFALLYPTAVYLNRGNHEDDITACRYDFFSEVLRKYGVDTYNSFVRVFRVLPLVTLVEDEIMVVHGGVPRHIVTLEEINGIDRKREIPLPGMSATASKEDMIMCDLVWSDPSDIEDYRFNTFRGQGILFGAKHTQEFCNRQNPPLKHIIRSHEVVPKGFHETHNGLVSTVFSASDYGGTETNEGAVAFIARNMVTRSLEVTFHPWRLHHNRLNECMEMCKRLSRPLHQSTRFVQEEVLRLVRQLVYSHRPLLLTMFEGADPEHRGVVGRNAWETILSTVAHIPWQTLRPYLIEVAEGADIPYPDFLNAMVCEAEEGMVQRWRPYFINWVLHIASTRVELAMTPSRLFTLVDRDGDGVVTYADVWTMFSVLLNTCVGTDDAYHFYRYFTTGTAITCERWLEVFAEAAAVGTVILEERNRSGRPQFYMWDVWLMQRFRECLSRKQCPLAVFRFLDRTSDKVLNTENFKEVLDTLQLKVAETKEIRRYKIERGAGDTEENIRDLLGGQTADELGVACAWPLSTSQIESFLRRSVHEPSYEASINSTWRRCATITFHDDTAVVTLVDDNTEIEVSVNMIRTAAEVSYRNFCLAWLVRDRSEDTKGPVWFEKFAPIWDAW